MWQTIIFFSFSVGTNNNLDSLEIESSQFWMTWKLEASILLLLLKEVSNKTYI